MDPFADFAQFSLHFLDLLSPFQSALLITTFISVAPLLVICLIPLVYKDSKGRSYVNQGLLKILLAFAIGGLLGDVFLHLIPHSFVDCHSHSSLHHGHLDESEHIHLPDTDFHDLFSSDSSDHIEVLHVSPPLPHDRDPQVIGLCVVVGILVFFTIDKFSRLFTVLRSSHHSHDNESPLSHDSHTYVASPHSRMAGILNIVADISHNFTDGLAIGGVCLTRSGKLAFSTGLAVFFHEIPHEIGDYAVLLQAGFSKRAAIIAQLITAVGAYLGMFTVLFLAHSIEEATSTSF